MPTRFMPARGGPSPEPPRIAADKRSSDDASHGWFESTWDLWRGLDVCEGLPLEQPGDDDTSQACQPAAQGIQAPPKDSGTALRAYYDLKTRGVNRYCFSLKAGNHEVILTSRVYGTKEDALEAVESVRRNSADRLRYERKLTTDSSPYFVLLAEDGEIIGLSEIYTSSAARENGIASVMSNGPTTSVKGLA